MIRGPRRVSSPNPRLTGQAKGRPRRMCRRCRWAIMDARDMGCGPPDRTRAPRARSSAVRSPTRNVSFIASGGHHVHPGTRRRVFWSWSWPVAAPSAGARHSAPPDRAPGPGSGRWTAAGAFFMSLPTMVWARPGHYRAIIPLPPRITSSPPRRRPPGLRGVEGRLREAPAGHGQHAARPTRVCTPPASRNPGAHAPAIGNGPATACPAASSPR